MADFENGAAVAISAPWADFNGREGMVVEFIAARQRYAVQILGSDEVVEIRRENLVNNEAHVCIMVWTNAAYRIELRYNMVLTELQHCDLGTNVEEVEQNLRLGVYIGLNMAHYRTGSGPLLCCFVGDEWPAQVQNLCSANACTHLVRPELLPLPDDRIGWLLPSRVTVQYHVFQRGDDDTAIAHLLCAVLTDSVRVAETCTLLYARLGLAEAA